MWLPSSICSCMGVSPTFLPFTAFSSHQTNCFIAHFRHLWKLLFTLSSPSILTLPMHQTSLFLSLESLPQLNASFFESPITKTPLDDAFKCRIPHYLQVPYNSAYENVLQSSKLVQFNSWTDILWYDSLEQKENRRACASKWSHTFRVPLQVKTRNFLSWNRNRTNYFGPSTHSMRRQSHCTQSDKKCHYFKHREKLQKPLPIPSCPLLYLISFLKFCI